MAGEPDFDLLAASLRADAGDRDAFLEVLARKLEDALPDRTRVERRPRKLLSREKVVRAIEVTLRENRYSLTREPGRPPEARRAKAVRGIVLKTEPLAIEAWIDELSRDLAAEAADSGEGRAALERLLM